MSRDVWLTLSKNTSDWIKENESDEQDRIDDYNEELRRYINQIWQMKKFPENIRTIKEEEIFIEIMRGKYIYPDYADLVGKPSSSNFESSPYGNYLSTERKADLLLLGAFTFRGMNIAKVPHYFSHALKGWEVCTDAEYVPSEGLGLVWAGQGEWITTPRYIDGCTFMPFYKYNVEPLHHYLTEAEIELGYRKPLSKFQKLVFRDKNAYNCNPGNITAAEKRGRKMYCVQCGKETTTKESKVIRDKKEKLRYCISCLKR